MGPSYCGEYDMNHPIEGSTAARAVVQTNIGSDIVTSLLVKDTGDTTIAYMGTRNGKLLKVNQKCCRSRQSKSSQIFCAV